MPHSPKTVASASSGAAKLIPSFRKTSDEAVDHAGQLAHVGEQQMAQYGYHDGGDRPLPPHLARYIEPTEGEFDKQVEYDMDEQDQAWLAEMNETRKKEQLDAVSFESFEIIMDRLEKEWFALVKRIPSRFSIGEAQEENTFPEESLCAICDDNECENMNAIVFCDGCNLAVHQDCYGIPYIPEGQWLCRKCTVSPDRPVSCTLCPNEGGAFKQTTRGAWAHLLCALWIPETGVANPVYMEPIDGVEDIPKARWRLRCYLCNSKSGACIQCEHRSCFTAFHVVCARRAGLLTQARRHRTDEEADQPSGEQDGAGSQPLGAYCHHHLSPAQKQALLARVRGQTEDGEWSDSDVSTSELLLPKKYATTPYESIASKSARAYNKLYSSGPLPVPNYIVHRVLEYIARINIRRKPQAVAQIVRYWSLKRQEMRGAPLLKRLHIEPWTVGNFVEERTNALRLAKLQYVYRLREDLEKVRLLAELVRKREKEKLRILRIFHAHVLDRAVFCVGTHYHTALQKLASMDRANWFLEPVSVDIAPDYYEVIQQPMTWTCIRARIDAFAYRHPRDMQADVQLLCDNAMQYNRPDSQIYKTAQKLAKHISAVFQELDANMRVLHDAPGMEPPEAVLRMLEAPPENAAFIPDAGASVMDAFLAQSYAEQAGTPPLSPDAAPRVQTLKRTREKAVHAPSRRSQRQSRKLEPEPVATEPRVLSNLDHKDSFKYFNTGWLLPPDRGT
ncbi:Nto1p [Malassezia vespertilionis]|uniref:Nto1p n=1 Tax=Malassezia vespertilionis TaxID=2020962 RepID=A0A2N1JBC3_9BASI|nr:Nto1p [Malassezia vespertilionis]